MIFSPRPRRPQEPPEGAFLSRRTPQQVAELVPAVAELLAEQLSWRQIAAALGLTKGAVSGIKRRHIDGIRTRHKPGGSRPRPAPKARQQPIPVVAVPAPEPLRLPGAASCQWPTSERPWTFCGAPVWRGAWCEAHWRRATGSKLQATEA